MNSCLLAASPSWYSSRVTDCSEEGHLLFGAKNSLYLLDVTQPDPCFADQLVVHQERVVGVSLCHGSVKKCVTASEDRRVRIWDLSNKTLVLEHSEHQGQPTVVHWSPLDTNLIVSGDDKGALVIWRLEGNNIRIFTPELGHIFCLTCSPHDRDVVAIGYKSGNILLADINRNGTILQKLRGHDEEIHCLCWSPIPGEDLSVNGSESSDELANGSLLASGSRDRMIKIWTTSDGRNPMTLKLPTNTGYRRDRYDDQNKNRAWLTICWPPNRPKQFISSTYGGDLLLWNLNRPGKQKWELFSIGEMKGHNRIVFNITSTPPEHNKICSISMDRQIIVWDLQTLEVKRKVATLGGFVYNLALSPLNPNRLALGVGDNMIRVCNLDSSIHVLNTLTLWQGIKSKVTSLCWHPVKEGRLGFGTEDGRVGIYDVLSQKSPLVSSTYHKRTVYVVAWGPPCPPDDVKNSGYCLYSCGDGTVLLHDPSKLDKPASDVNKIICKQNNIPKCLARSEISFKPDWSSVAFGNEDGSVEVYSVPDLYLQCTIQVHKKLVNVVRWHPEYTAESGETSRYSCWLAIGSNEYFISVVDLQNILERDPATKEMRYVTDTMCRLEGHSNRITGLSWSFHREAQIVSASYDGSAQVWDVKNVQPMANYRGHSGRLFCTQWSMTDPDVIYTGADDFSVHAWRISQQEHIVPPKGKEWLKKKKAKGKSKGSKEMKTSLPAVSPGGDKERKFDNKDSMDTLQEVLAAKRKELESQALLTRETKENGETGEEAAKTVNQDDQNDYSVKSEDSITGKCLPKAPQEVLKSAPKTDASKKGNDGMNRKKRRDRSLFPVFNTMETRGKLFVQEDTVDLASLLYTGKDSQGNCQLSENQTHLGLFTDRNATYQHLDKEENHHTEHGNNNQLTLLNIWKGDLGDTLRQAAAKKQLNDWLMALAPMASPKLWRELCVAYARQLEDDGFLHRAASYLLAVHKIHDAIDVFVRHKQYRDAVSLARCRLCSDDPILAQLYTEWANNLVQENSYEQAAQCYLAIRKSNDAAAVLARRSDCQALKAAVHITLFAGEMSSFKYYATRFIQECLTVGDWSSAAEVLEWHTSLKGLALYTTTHELLCQDLVKLKLFVVEEPKYSLLGQVNNAEGMIPKFLLDPNVKDVLSSWQPVTREGQPLIHHILGPWCLSNRNSLTNDKLLEYLKELTELAQLKQASMAVKQVIQSVALYVSIGLLCLLLCDQEEAAHWWSVAMAACNDSQQHEILIGLCQILLPQGPDKLFELQQQVTAIRLSAGENAIGTGPATPRDPGCMKFSHFDVEGRKDVGNNRQFCTSHDCLSAYYYLAVLRGHLIKKADPEVKDVKNIDTVEASHSGKDETDAVRDVQEGLKTFDILSEETLNAKGETTLGDQSVSVASVQKGILKYRDNSHENSHFLSLPEKKLYQLSQKLLWNIQVRKLELHETLFYIQKAMKMMINRHQKQQGDQNMKGGEEDNDENSGQYDSVGQRQLLSTPPFICRSISGEYFHMKPGSTSFLKSPLSSPRSSPRRYISPNGKQRKRCDSDGHEEMMPSIDENGSNSPEGDLALDSMTHSGIVQTRIYAKAHNIFSTEMSQSTEADAGEPNNTEKDVTSHLPDTNIDESCQSVILQKKLHNRPLDTRYTGEYVTVSTLSAEHQRVTAELHEVTCMMKSTPFPHPLESAKLLTQILMKLPEDDREILNVVCHWALDHAFLSEHQLYFSTVDLCSDQ